MLPVCLIVRLHFLLSDWLYVCLCCCLTDCPSAILAVCLIVRLHSWMSDWFYVCLSCCLPFLLFHWLSIWLSIRLFLSICLCVCLTMFFRVYCIWVKRIKVSPSARGFLTSTNQQIDMNDLHFKKSRRTLLFQQRHWFISKPLKLLQAITFK